MHRGKKDRIKDNYNSLQTVFKKSISKEQFL